MNFLATRVLVWMEIWIITWLGNGEWLLLQSVVYRLINDNHMIQLIDWRFRRFSGWQARERSSLFGVAIDFLRGSRNYIVLMKRLDWDQATLIRNRYLSSLITTVFHLLQQLVSFVIVYTQIEWDGVIRVKLKAFEWCYFWNELDSSFKSTVTAKGRVTFIFFVLIISCVNLDFYYLKWSQRSALNKITISQYANREPDMQKRNWDYESTHFHLNFTLFDLILIRQQT